MPIMPHVIIVHPEHSLADLIAGRIERQATALLRSTQFELQGRDVVLRGEVHTWHQKQIAQECLRGIHGLGRVINQLAVAGTR